MLLSLFLSVRRFEKRGGADTVSFPNTLSYE